MLKSHAASAETVNETVIVKNMLSVLDTVDELVRVERKLIAWIMRVRETLFIIPSQSWVIN